MKSKKSSEAAEPDYPLVKLISPVENVYRWTFSTGDREIQDREFGYWKGWFGFDEDEQPHEVNGKVWLIRRRMPG